MSWFSYILALFIYLFFLEGEILLNSQSRPTPVDPALVTLFQLEGY